MYGLRNLRRPNSHGATHDAYVTMILSKPNQLENWMSLVRVAFLRRKGRDPAKDEVTVQSVGKTLVLLYDVIRGHLEGDLRPVIELRNKMAHGQWSKPFVNWTAPYLFADLKISGTHMKNLRSENLLTLILKREMINRILDIIRDLAVSPVAFTRDYDEHYKRINNASIQLRKKKYALYAKNLVERYNRGIALRQK